MKFEIGKRYLVTEKYSSTPVEIAVIDLSPSKLRMKIHFQGGNTVWREVADYNFLEELSMSVYDVLVHNKSRQNDYISPLLGPKFFM